MKKKVKLLISIMTFVFMFMGMMKVTDVYAAGNITSIRITTPPEKKEYYIFEEDILAGTAVEVTYDVGTPETISYGKPEWDELFESSIMDGELVIWLSGNENIEDRIPYTPEEKSIAVYPDIKPLTKGELISAKEDIEYNVFSYTTPDIDGKYIFAVNGKINSYCDLYEGDTYCDLGDVENAGDRYNMPVELQGNTTYYFVVRNNDYGEIKSIFEVTLADATDEPHEHTGDWKLTKAPTCTTPGEETRTCPDCGETETRIIEAFGHDYMIVVMKHPTCGEVGIQNEQCSLCGYIKETVSLPKTDDHKYSSWTAVAPTCTTGGYEFRACSVCGKVEKRNEKAALGHSYQEVVDQTATCVTAGSKHNECTRCHDKQTAVTISATGHNFGDWVRTKEPTALAAGTDTRTCQHCGIPEQREVAKLKPVIKLSATKLPLQVKKSTTALKVTAMQKGDKVAYWKSSNTKVVKVHKTRGTLTAGKKTGKATILVKLRSGKTAKCLVTVQKGKVTTKSIKLSSRKLTIKRGKSVKLSAILNPLTSQDKVTFTSSNKKVATVTSKGTIKGRKKGTTKITVKSGKKKVTCTVTVK